jgi:N-sulfoglucosamine sulfohydrolase
MRHPAALLLALAIATPALAGPGRNVVLIVADDQGLELGCYGHRAIKTPHLDRLAAEGTRFTHAFATTASCSASRSVLLTGLQNHANGQYGHQHMPYNFHTFDRVKGLPVLLSAAGYRTARIGKFHVQPESVYRFDHDLSAGVPGGARNPAGMAERVREFLASDDERPFFLYFCPVDPHRAAVGFGNDREYPGVEEVRFRPEEVIVPPFLPDNPEVRAELAEYYQAVARLDQGVGRLVQVLEETGHRDDTLVIYLSDNGIPFPAAKTTLYEPGIRLPLIVRSPDQQTRGRTCDAMVSFTDIAPTILEFTDAGVPDYPLQGHSFLGLLDTENAEGWDEVFVSHTFHEIQMYYPMRAVRTRRYKLIYNIAHPLPFPFASDLYASTTWQGVLRRGDSQYGKRTVAAYIRRPKLELYDLQADPDEVRNLADDPDFAAVRDDLMARLVAFQKRTSDPWITKHEYE